MTGSREPGEEGVPRARQGHHPAHPVQPAGHCRQDVCCHVRPHRHAAQLADIPATADAVHAGGGRQRRRRVGRHGGVAQVAALSNPPQVSLSRRGFGLFLLL